MIKHLSASGTLHFNWVSGYFSRFLILYMPYSKEDIARFQKLYQHCYQKEINSEEAITKIDALVDLIRLAIEYELSN